MMKDLDFIQTAVIQKQKKNEDSKRAQERKNNINFYTAAACFATCTSTLITGFLIAAASGCSLNPNNNASNNSDGNSMITGTLFISFFATFIATLTTRLISRKCCAKNGNTNSETDPLLESGLTKSEIFAEVKKLNFQQIKNMVISALQEDGELSKKSETQINKITLTLIRNFNLSEGMNNNLELEINADCSIGNSR